MKLSKITASTNLQIPEPFDKWYVAVSDEQVENELGWPAHPSPCEECEGYNVVSISYLEPKPEYMDKLSNSGIGDVELLNEDGDIFIGYCVGDRIYSVTEDDIEMAGIDPYEDTVFEDDDDFDYEDDDDDEYYDEVDACGDVTAAIDTGLTYWYFTRHGLGPGMMPKGVNILDTYEEGYKTWFKVDKLFTTEELNEYDIKEEWPPEGAVTNHGEVIESFTDVPIEGSEAELQFLSNRLPYGNMAGARNRSIFYRGYQIVMNAIKKLWEIRDRSNNLIQEGFATKDDAIDYIQDSGLVAASTDIDEDYSIECASACKKVSEDDKTINYVVSSDDIEDDADASENIEGMSLVNYKNYKLLCDPSAGGWEVLDRNHNLVQSGFPSEKSARTFVDTQILDEINGADEVMGTADIENIDLDSLKKDIEAGCEEYLTGPEGGFLPSGSPKESKWDMTADEIYVVEVNDDGDRIEVEVRAELGYDGMSRLSEILNPIIQKYDPDAYFDMEMPGIMNAYIYSSDYVESSTDINGAVDSSYTDFYNEEALDRHDRDFTRVEYEEPRPKDPLIIQFDFDFDLEVDETGEWEPLPGEDPIEDADDYAEEGVPRDRLTEDFLDMLIWYIPDSASKFNVSGKATLRYDYEDEFDEHPMFRAKYSNVTDVECKPAGKIESSTDVSASMTEDELDEAILEGRPFDIDDFKKYKNPVDPNAVIARDVKLGDVIDVECDASEVNLGTVVKVVAINDPPESWIDFTFRCEVVDMFGRADKDTSLKIGDVIDLHFDADEDIGYLVTSN